MTETIKIGFCGKAGSGKSEAAHAVAEYLNMIQLDQHAKVFPLAYRLKKALTAMFDISDDDWQRKFLQAHGGGTLSIREWCQLLGHDVGRKMVDEHLWCNLWETDILIYERKLREAGGQIKWLFAIADDVRYDNEAELCDLVIRINRTYSRGNGGDRNLGRKEKAHASENTIVKHDFEILTNDPDDIDIGIGWGRQDEVLLLKQTAVKVVSEWIAANKHPLGYPNERI